MLLVLHTLQFERWNWCYWHHFLFLILLHIFCLRCCGPKIVALCKPEKVSNNLSWLCTQNDDGPILFKWLINLKSVSTETLYLFAVCCPECRDQKQICNMPVVSHSHISIHVTESQLSLTWTEKSFSNKWQQSSCLRLFWSCIFQTTHYLSEVTAHIMLGWKGTLWIKDMAWMELSRLYFFFVC